jgi:protein-S-isoprenylcysteine O-methyltransferase Ste14
MKPAEEKRSIKFGAMFQLPMMVFFIAMLHLYGSQAQWWSAWLWPSHAGSALFAYCLIRLYTLKAKDNRLITTGPFRYTRHPMYTGLMLMDLIFWLPHPVSSQPLFFLLQAAFIFCLLTAAYFQEKETLARFGKAAEDYYAKTPRLFLFYPLSGS